MIKYFTSLLVGMLITMNHAHTQVSMEFSTGYAVGNHMVFEDEVFSGDHTSNIYNPLNFGIHYDIGRFRVGMDLYWIEYVNNFNRLLVVPNRSFETRRSPFSTYLNGGYDRSQLATMLNFSYSFFKERILSLHLGVGAGHNFNNYLRNLTYRDIYQSGGFTVVATSLIDGNKGYSVTTTYELAIRLTSPQSFPVPVFLEASYLGNSPIWNATRLNAPREGIIDRAAPPFGNNAIFLRAGFAFDLSMQKVQSIDKGEN